MTATPTDLATRLRVHAATLGPKSERGELMRQAANCLTRMNETFIRVKPVIASGYQDHAAIAELEKALPLNDVKRLTQHRKVNPNPDLFRVYLVYDRTNRPTSWSFFIARRDALLEANRLLRCEPANGPYYVVRFTFDSQVREVKSRFCPGNRARKEQP